MDKKIKHAIARIKWPTSAEMDELMDKFVRQFSQAYFDAYGEKMEDVDAEEFATMIKIKLKKANG